MKRNITILFVLTLFLTDSLISQQKGELLKSKYFIFQGDPQLNAHLMLYNRSMSVKYKKVPDDSLAFSAFRDKIKMIKSVDVPALNEALKFYRDSLLSKDLLFDSLMRDFSDQLVKTSFDPVKWQRNAYKNLKAFMPFFDKNYWPGIQAANKAWITTHKAHISRLETIVVPELERIYQMQLPESKVLVDLTCYATWAGAYSFNDSFCHVVFSSTNTANQGDMGVETVFHESSHFLVDKLSNALAAASRGKDVKKTINLWHNMIFYTTATVLGKQAEKEKKKFTPYYVHMRFEDKFPDFKASIEACRQYWDPYIAGTMSFEEAVTSIVAYVTEKK